MIIYPFHSNIDMWKVFIYENFESPYKGKWYYLYVRFPELYPFHPPIFKFVSVPYHVNISKDGQICLNIIGKDYVSSIHVIEIIQEIRDLLTVPQMGTPISNEILEIKENDSNVYDLLAAESTDKNGKSSYNDFLNSVSIVDDQPKDYD